MKNVSLNAAVIFCLLVLLSVIAKLLPAIKFLTELAFASVFLGLCMEAVIYLRDKFKYILETNNEKNKKEQYKKNTRRYKYIK